jgi:NAD(P)-dependent dehydrogenase (short-subunit alcohol dehydrogenase family)
VIKTTKFETAIRAQRAKLPKLDGARVKFEQNGQAFEANLCLSGHSSCRKVCDAADELIQSMRLENLDSQRAVDTAHEMFVAFTASIDVLINNAKNINISE